tara:strand:+ start:254 stop:523 length:270 start_codon:yes stop_codon:yes gene_type:complete
MNSLMEKELYMYVFMTRRNPMTKYEVRVTQTHVDYYHVDAESEEDAQYKIKQRVTTDKTTAGKKVDTILRQPVLDYALELCDNGEVTYD